MKKEQIFSIGQQYEVIDKTTASRIIFSGRCLLFTVLLSADGGSTWAKVYDSRTATGKEVMLLRGPEDKSFQWKSVNGVVMEQGIYIEVYDDKANVSVTFSPLEKKSFRGE